eukprot:365998-Chlamydomonas_euryale.AAC.4
MQKWNPGPVPHLFLPGGDKRGRPATCLPRRILCKANQCYCGLCLNGLHSQNTCCSLYQTRRIVMRADADPLLGWELAAYASAVY